MAAVYQSLFGGDVYPSLEEKVANLLFNEIDRSEVGGIRMSQGRIVVITGSATERISG